MGVTEGQGKDAKEFDYHWNKENSRYEYRNIVRLPLANGCDYVDGNKKQWRWIEQDGGGWSIWENDEIPVKIYTNHDNNLVGSYKPITKTTKPPINVEISEKKYFLGADRKYYKMCINCGMTYRGEICQRVDNCRQYAEKYLETCVVCSTGAMNWVKRCFRKDASCVACAGSGKISKSSKIFWTEYKGYSKKERPKWLKEKRSELYTQRRRMAVREHSNRRDSPVMLRLLKEII